MTIREPDPVYPLQMWLCSDCGLAQLLDDPTVPEEPKGTEPAALVAQAADAVARVAAAGLLRPERGSPSTAARTAVPGWACWPTGACPGGRRRAQADVIIDCFGMMHAADQAAALAERAARLAPGGVLLLQYHSLDTIIRHGQWNALRHGHYAYYSTTALSAMLAAVGFSPRTAWRFDLYGGTVLLAAAPRRRHDPSDDGADETVRVSARRRGPHRGARPGRRCAGCSRTSRPAPRAARLARQAARPTEDRARLRCRLPGRRAAAPGRRWTATCCPRWRTPRRQAGAAHAGDRDPGHQPGRVHRAAPG